MAGSVSRPSRVQRIGGDPAPHRPKVGSGAATFSVRTARNSTVPRRLAAGNGPELRTGAGLPGRGGGLWRDHDWRTWRRRVFDPLAKSIAHPACGPYDLRHCSLLIAEGASVVEVARQAGHSPTMTLDTSAHVMADSTAPSGCERKSQSPPPAARLTDAGWCPPEAPARSRPGKASAVPGSPLPDSNRRPLPYHQELDGRRTQRKGLQDGSSATPSRVRRRQTE